ncbi:MAG: cyclic nucleotide-binding domain-containing protein [Epsilonproteobacteria bacterium]|nr:cyclic nucleotide-binding domain-containing protein [Campylobacterota bacterium]
MHKLFKNLNEDEYKTALEYFEEIEFESDQYIVKEEENSDLAFILKEGAVNIIKVTIYKDDYVIDTIYAPSENIFGEVNLIDCGKVTSTIKTKTKVKILQITHDNFKKLTHKHPLIGVKMFWTISNDLSKHLRKADQDVITLFNALVEAVEND